jgi:hypothetical protein
LSLPAAYTFFTALMIIITAPTVVIRLRLAVKGSVPAWMWGSRYNTQEKTKTEIPFFQPTFDFKKWVQGQIDFDTHMQQLLYSILHFQSPS